MLKKKIVMFVAAALMTLSASSAFAAFGDLELIRVVYERTTGTVEYATDLGNINTLLAAPGTTIAGNALSATNANNLFVAYFAMDRNAGGVTNSPDLWVSGSTNTALAPVAVGTLGFNTAKSGTTNVYNYYNSLTPVAGVVTGDQAFTNSYRKSLSASQGAISNAINIATRPYTEASLASLINGTATSVAQSLYYFANGNTANSKGVEVTQIFTNDDGSTTIGVAPTAATPIPPAFFLMGSGLLGMFGLRRKTKAA